MAIYSIGQLQTLLRQGGFPESLIVTMAAIGMAESSGNSNAVNNGSGTRSVEYSVGLFQINTRVHKNFSVEQLKIPEINVKEALRIYKTQGLRAWGAYTDGNYRRFLPASQTASGKPPAPVPVKPPVLDVVNDNSVLYLGLAALAVFLILE